MNTGYSGMFLIATISLLMCLVQLDGYNLNIVHEWVQIEYDYASPTQRQNAIGANEFIPGAARLIDVDIFYDKSNVRQMFVTTPRITSGIPATIGTVTNKTYNGHPVIAPYPTWEWHTNAESCPTNRIVSVFRMKIDECQRLWILDTASSSFVQKCPPQILAFDLKTNRIIHRYEIPSKLLQSNSLLTNLVVDIRNVQTCSGTFVYVADTRAFSLIVHDVDNSRSWKINDKTFHASPDFGTICIAGSQFELMDGLQGMTLSPLHVQSNDRVLFYHSLASNTEQWVWTSKIRNRSAFLNSPNPDPKIFHVYCGRRDTQISPMATDKTGVVYFGLAKHTSLNCWNIELPYGMHYIHELDRSLNLQYITGIKIVSNWKGVEELWFSNTRVKRIVDGPSNDNIFNYIIHTANIKDLSKYCGNSWQGSYSQSQCSSSCTKCVNGIFFD